MNKHQTRRSLLAVLLAISASARSATTRDTASASRPSVVKIAATFDGGGGTRRGFGFIAGERGGALYIATANHVVRSAEADLPAVRVTVEFFGDQGVAYEGKLLANHRARPTDLAIIKIEKPKAVGTAPLCSDARSLTKGAKAVYVGRDGKWYVPGSDGVVNSEQPNEQSILEVDFSRSVDVKEGTSGGPLFSRNGVIGMVIVDSNSSVASVLAIDAIEKVFRGWNYPWDAKACDENTALPEMASGGSSLAPGPGAGVSAAVPRDPEAHRHLGFLLRPDLGGGYLSASTTLNGTDASISGAAGTGSLAIGYALVENLIVGLHGFEAVAAGPSVTSGSRSVSNANGRLTLSGLGPELTYYFMPVNLFVSVTGAVTFLNLAVNNAESSATLGFGGRLALGKEWWVSDHWGLGVTGQYSLGINPDSGSSSPPTWTTWAASVAFSATYN